MMMLAIFSLASVLSSNATDNIIKYVQGDYMPSNNGYNHSNGSGDEQDEWQQDDIFDILDSNTGDDSRKYYFEVPPTPSWRDHPQFKESDYPELPKMSYDSIIAGLSIVPDHAESSFSSNPPHTASRDSASEESLPMPFPPYRKPTFNTVSGTKYRNGARYAGWYYERGVTDEEKATVALRMCSKWKCDESSAGQNMEVRRRMAAWITPEYAKMILDPSTSEDVIDNIAEKTIGWNNSAYGMQAMKIERILMQRGIKVKSTLFNYRKKIVKMLENGDATTIEEAVQDLIRKFKSKPKKKIYSHKAS